MPGEELLILGAGGAAVVVAGHAAPPPAAPTKLAPNGGVVIAPPPPGSTVAGPQKGTPPTYHLKTVVGHSSATTVKPAASTFEVGIHATQTSNSGTPSDDPHLYGKLAVIEAGFSHYYDNTMTVQQKQAGADKLNAQLKPDPPIDANADYKKVAGIVGGLVGGVVGGYFGGPLGAKIGAIIGAYVGAELEELVYKNWDEIVAWVSSAWGDVSDFASTAYDDTIGEVVGIF